MGTMTSTTQALTQVEFEGEDFAKAEKIAAALGFEQTAYTSTSALWGLFCLPENPEYAKPGQATRGGCIIKTLELGFLFVQDGEDLHMGYGFEDVTARYMRGRVDVTHSLSDLKALPTLSVGQADDLKIDTGNRRVWLSRCTVEDGEPCNNKVTIEEYDGDLWTEIGWYEAI